MGRRDPGARRRVTSETTLPLLGLLAVLFITRPLEERAWKASRISTRVAAWLIVARLPALGFGFGVIIGLDPIEVGVLTVIGLVAAFVLHPVAVGRLEQARAQGRGGPPAG